MSEPVITPGQWKIVGAVLVAAILIALGLKAAGVFDSLKRQEEELAKVQSKRIELQAQRITEGGGDALSKGMVVGAQDAMLFAARGERPTKAQIAAMGLTTARAAGIPPQGHEDFAVGYSVGFRKEFKAQLDW
jgi:hypothetical protein